jgi:hypothetical protein
VKRDDEQRRFVELQAYGPDDPDGSYTAAVVAAYFEAERIRAACRVLWPRLAGVAIIWVVLAMTPPHLSSRVLAVGLLIVGVAAVRVAARQWRARTKLTRLLESHPQT